MIPVLTYDPFETDLSGIALFHPTVFAFGGGLNSTAYATKWVMDGYEPPQLILMADTGNERPDVYEHVARFSEWLVAHGMPPITWTKKGGRPETLEQYSLRTKMLPSMAYGRKGCSHKFKIEPQERDVNRWSAAKACWKRGDKVVKIIGYGFEEQTRISKAKIEDDKYFYRFPLDEWQVDREGCVAIIKRAGLPVPGKSACFFCPSMRKPEIIQLRDESPDLLARALHIEKTANDAGRNKTSKGLGRRFAWVDFLAGIPVVEAPASPCMYCVDDSPEPVFKKPDTSSVRYLVSTALMDREERAARDEDPLPWDELPAPAKDATDDELAAWLEKYDAYGEAEEEDLFAC